MHKGTVMLEHEMGLFVATVQGGTGYLCNGQVFTNLSTYNIYRYSLSNSTSESPNRCKLRDKLKNIAPCVCIKPQGTQKPKQLYRHVAGQKKNSQWSY